MSVTGIERRPGRAVHCDDHAEPTPEQVPLPDALTHEPIDKKSPAQWAYERLILYIQNFELKLDRDHEVAMGFVGGDAGVLRIEGLGYFDPDIVTFYGAERDGTKTQLVQHVSQLNVMLKAMPRPKEEKDEEPYRIGFRLARDLEQGQDGDQEATPGAK
ncbi:DUF6173 family protein [Maritimibacter sp. DP1N21-5]|uniref:DUF6173 family protein n=1 Tax=Maritimibacter sp. DP1N21-5 TaxID=2836867 RepID=UPI001C484B0E|nr:DUF6173 family protein [Maritimibacter sp. DP1N21-5]MBV7407865.1 hypothetical protein [Maritimibacter sp. DP1N21-5]